MQMTRRGNPDILLDTKTNWTIDARYQEEMSEHNLPLKFSGMRLPMIDPNKYYDATLTNAELVVANMPSMEFFEEAGYTHNGPSDLDTENLAGDENTGSNVKDSIFNDPDLNFSNAMSKTAQNLIPGDSGSGHGNPKIIPTMNSA
jgi:hypothetical protein